MMSGGTLALWCFMYHNVYLYFQMPLFLLGFEHFLQISSIWMKGGWERSGSLKQPFHRAVFQQNIFWKARQNPILAPFYCFQNCSLAWTVPLLPCALMKPAFNRSAHKRGKSEHHVQPHLINFCLLFMSSRISDFLHFESLPCASL